METPLMEDARRFLELLGLPERPLLDVEVTGRDCLAPPPSHDASEPRVAPLFQEGEVNGGLNG
jgi:hypothetical protein